MQLHLSNHTAIWAGGMEEPRRYLWCCAEAQTCTDPEVRKKTKVASKMCLAPYWWPSAISLNAAWELNSISFIQPQSSDKGKAWPEVTLPETVRWGLKLECGPRAV